VQNARTGPLDQSVAECGKCLVIHTPKVKTPGILYDNNWTLRRLNASLFYGREQPEFQLLKQCCATLFDLPVVTISKQELVQQRKWNGSMHDEQMGGNVLPSIRCPRRSGRDLHITGGLQWMAHLTRGRPVVIPRTVGHVAIVPATNICTFVDVDQMINTMMTVETRLLNVNCKSQASVIRLMSVCQTLSLTLSKSSQDDSRGAKLKLNRRSWQGPCTIDKRGHNGWRQSIGLRVREERQNMTAARQHRDQPSYLHNVIVVQPSRSTCSSPTVTLTRPSTSPLLRITDCPFHYKTKLESVSLSCKRHRSKKANIKILSPKFNAQMLAIIFMSVSGLSITNVKASYCA